MYIKELHITAFGPIVDGEITASRGLNIIEGANESGKSTVASFIKFIFYGLSSRGSDGISEKQKYINWERGVAAGYIVVENADGEFRIERSLSCRETEAGKVKFSESVKLLDNGTNMPIKLAVSPGEHFFGTSETVFTNSSFVSQTGELRPDSGAVKDSLENMISAADENVSVKRAADALEKARVRLLHKNRGGGEIYELEGRINRLEDTLESAKEKSARLIRAEVSLADVKEKLAVTRKRSEELERIAGSLSVLDAGTRLDRTESVRKSLGEAKTRLASETARGADEKFISSLTVAVRDLDKFGKVSAEHIALQKSLGEDSHRIPDEDADAAYGLLGRSRAFFTASMVFLILGLLGFGASAFFPSLPFLVATAVLIIGGIVSLCLCFSSKRRVYDILDEWGIEDEEELAEMTDGSAEYSEELVEKKAELDAAQKSAFEAADTLDFLASSVGLGDRAAGMTPADVAKMLGKFAAESAAKRRALEAECSRLEGQLAAIENAASAEGDEVRERIAALLETEEGKRAAEMTPEDRSAAERERIFNAQKAENLREREIELERECAALRAECPAPADAAEMLSDMKQRLSAMKRAHASYILALETLTAAGEGIRSSVVPRLTSGASEILSKVTGGRYSKLGMSAGFDMSFRTEDFGTKELDYLSGGTKDAAYLALRLSLVKALYEEDKRPPVIFDESFAYFDEERVKAALELLSEDDTQTFLFTCRSLEGKSVTKGSVTRLPSPKRI